MTAVTISFRFPESRSHDLPWLIERAKRGTFREQRTRMGTREVVLYETQFVLPSSLAELQPLIELTAMLRFARHGQIFVDGVQQEKVVFAGVLACYRQSLQVSDVRGHCWAPVQLYGEPIIDVGIVVKTIELKEQGLLPHELAVTRKHWLFPCRHAQTWGKLDPLHPATLRSQAEAVIVRRGCAWCPQLRIDEWEVDYGTWTIPPQD